MFKIKNTGGKKKDRELWHTRTASATALHPTNPTQRLRMGAKKEVARRRCGPKLRKSGSPKGWEPKISRSSSLSRSHCRFFFSLWGSSGGMFIVFEAPDPQMCTFGVLGLSCETRRQKKNGNPFFFLKKNILKLKKIAYGKVLPRFSCCARLGRLVCLRGCHQNLELGPLLLCQASWTFHTSSRRTHSAHVLLVNQP